MFNKLRRAQDPGKSLDPLQYLPLELAELVVQNLEMRDRVYVSTTSHLLERYSHIIAFVCVCQSHGRDYSSLLINSGLHLIRALHESQLVRDSINGYFSPVPTAIIFVTDQCSRPTCAEGVSQTIKLQTRKRHHPL